MIISIIVSVIHYTFTAHDTEINLIMNNINTLLVIQESVSQDRHMYKFTDIPIATHVKFNKRVPIGCRRTCTYDGLVKHCRK